MPQAAGQASSIAEDVQRGAESLASDLQRSAQEASSELQQNLNAAASEASRAADNISKGEQLGLADAWQRIFAGVGINRGASGNGIRHGHQHLVRDHMFAAMLCGFLHQVRPTGVGARSSPRPRR